MSDVSVHPLSCDFIALYFIVRDLHAIPYWLVHVSIHISVWVTRALPSCSGCRNKSVNIFQWLLNTKTWAALYSAWIFALSPLTLNRLVSCTLSNQLFSPTYSCSVDITTCIIFLVQSKQQAYIDFPFSDAQSFFSPWPDFLIAVPNFSPIDDRFRSFSIQVCVSFVPPNIVPRANGDHSEPTATVWPNPLSDRELLSRSPFMACKNKPRGLLLS